MASVAPSSIALAYTRSTAFVLSTTKAIIVPSRSTAADLGRFYPTGHDNTFVVPHGIAAARDVDPLLATVKAATEAGIAAAGVDARLCDVSEAVEEELEEYPVVEEVARVAAPEPPPSTFPEVEELEPEGSVNLTAATAHGVEAAAGVVCSSSRRLCSSRASTRGPAQLETTGGRLRARGRRDELNNRGPL